MNCPHCASTERHLRDVTERAFRLISERYNLQVELQESERKREALEVKIAALEEALAKGAK